MGFRITPHMLRHTFAAQLLNVGAKVTTIQRLLGHARLQTTLTYARVYDRTVAEDFYAAIAQVEQRLTLPARGAPVVPETHMAVMKRKLLRYLDALQESDLDDRQQVWVDELQRGFLTLLTDGRP